LLLRIAASIGLRALLLLDRIAAILAVVPLRLPLLGIPLEGHPASIGLLASIALSTPSLGLLGRLLRLLVEVLLRETLERHLKLLRLPLLGVLLPGLRVGHLAS
jgi:hypothetical protein